MKYKVMIRNAEVGADVEHDELDSPTRAQQMANDWNRRYGVSESQNGGAYVKPVK